VEVCENFWDACISDDPLAKYNGSIVYGDSSCRPVTDSACGPNRVVASSIPGSQPDDTTLGAFDLGPYSTVSQPTAVPSVQVLSYTSTARTDSGFENGGGLGSTSQAASASTTSGPVSTSRRNSATTTSMASAAATPSKNAAQVLALGTGVSRTVPGILGIVLFWL
jgi:hypothetical protein